MIVSNRRALENKWERIGEADIFDSDFDASTAQKPSTSKNREYIHMAIQESI